MESRSTNNPEPETLQPKGVKQAVNAPNPGATPTLPSRRIGGRTYRPSHKATFIGIAVIIAILAINIVVIGFFLQPHTTASAQKNDVTLSTDTLGKLGVNRDVSGNSGTQLTINPNAKFNGTVTVAGDENVAGQFKLNGAFTANSASFAKLQAGDTGLNSLNVNGDGTVSNLNLRKDLAVAGTVHVQGASTFSGIVTVNNNLNISGNIAIGGTFSSKAVEGSSVVADSILAIGGHVVTRGSAPGVGSGSGVGANGTVSISGNDAAGTIAVNTGTGAGNGVLAQVSFRTAYANTPHVVVTPIGAAVPGLYVNRTSYGFSISASGGMSPGGYAFDYWVVQ